ncbi:type VI secretion system protein TssL, long form [Scandinavium goeteborgense]|uniref:type VI secretion system protein TssL, long form n=1 Tax=Scandinavium goeteborgense TaxID=1851514 RepID=UPI0037F8BB44
MTASNAADEESLQALGKFLLDDSGSFTVDSSLGGHDPQPSPAARIQATRGEKPHIDILLKGESVQQRVAQVKASAMPLLEASQPLLRALSEMPEEIADATHADLLKRALKSEITLFGVVCDEADISWKKMAIVRYCLCTALDEAAHATGWGLSVGWSQSNLLNHFEGDNDGGNKFFLLLGRLSVSPHEYADVLNVLLRILSLGLEGRYSILDEGERQLTKIRQRLLILLQSTRDTVPGTLSPHGAASRDVVIKNHFFIPVRVMVLLGVLLVGGMFIWFKAHLGETSLDLEERSIALQRLKATHVVPERLRLAVLLKDEIQKHRVTVDETQSQSKVVLNSDSMFVTGSAQVLNDSIPVLRRVAREIIRVKGQVVIIGHTDAIPIHKPDIPNNQILSEKRATDVAQILITEGVPASTVQIRGAGDSQPVSGNNDLKGRALNRRVEIFVTY